MGQVVLGRDLVGRLGLRQRLHHVALVAQHLGGAAGGGFQLGAVAGRVVGAVGAVVPRDLQGLAALHGGPGVGGHHGHTAQGFEHGGAGEAGQLDHALHTGHFQGFSAVHAAQLAAEHRGAGHHGIDHAGQAHVHAVLRLAAGDGLAVHRADLALADVAELGRVFQLELVGGRQRQARGVGGHLTEAQAAAGGRVQQRVLTGLHLAGGHAPARGRSGFEHLAGGGAGAAHGQQEVAHAA